MQAWIDRWQNLRLTTFSDQTLTSLADELSSQIGTAAADRDSARFPENASQHNGYAGEIDHFKMWMRERAKWIDQQFLLPPTVTVEGNNITLTPAPGAQIAYTTNASDPRRSGGQTAAGVLISNAPVVLANSTHFLARSYRTGVPFPATPWSRAVSINDATTSTPPPFIATLKNTVVASDNSASFSAEGTPGSIQWQVSTDGGSTWANVSDNDVYRGATSTTLTIARASTTLDGAQFRFTATHNGATSTSNTATLTVELTVFRAPTGIVVGASGDLYVADSTTDSIHKITTAGLVSPFATGASSPLFNRPGGMATLPDGTLIVADSANATIKRIDAAGTVTILAGQTGVRGSADGTGTAATFSSPADVAVDASGNLFVADATNHTIRKITSSGVVTTYAGTAGASGSIDANGTAARFNLPVALTADHNGILYVADSINHAIRQISPTGGVTTFAGLPGVAGYDDGTGIHALFNRPGGIAADDAGNLYVSDTGNSTLRKITATGVVTTVAGTPGIAGIDNGIGALALFNQPKYLTLDSAGNLLVSDTGNALIRKITPDGATTILSLALVPPDSGGETTPPPDPGNDGGTSPGSGGGGGGGSGGGGISGLGFVFSLALLALLRFFPTTWRSDR